ncbi:MAG: protein kinase [Phycisphaerae bacterium]|nr:protein kinase [Phycisphaerae bacterium]
MSTNPPSDPDGGRSPERRLIDAAFQQEVGPLAEPSPVSGAPSPLCGFGEHIPGYEITREIHRGGQGVVYQAVQEGTKRKVAIKVMREGPFAGPKDKARFDREVEVLGQLNHPNIVAIHNSGSVAGMFYFVMDYISGQPLDVWMASGKRSIEETLKLFVKICEAVNAAHLKGIIHRDLKPGNIRIDSSGVPYVLDFGLAKMSAGTEPSLMTVTGQFMGSLPWASPEQAQAAPANIDIRTDVYSLGVILYQMLTGRFPYEVVGNIRDVLDRIMKTEPARPSTIRRQINDEVETIVLKCLSKERERRYQSAGELARDIGHYLAGDPIEAKHDSALYVLRKSLRRYKTPVAVAASFVVLLAVSAVVLFVMAEKNRRLAESEGQAKRQAQAATTQATAERDRAEHLRQATEFQAYVANLAVAEAELRAHDIAMARTRLDLCPQSFRQWEWYHLDTMCDRSIATLPYTIAGITHNRRRSCVKVSPDGARLVVGARDNAATLSDTLTGAEVATLRGHTGEIKCLAFSPDSRRVLTGSGDKTARLWDASTGALLSELNGHTGAVLEIDFSPDGTRIATGSADQTARLWDASTGTEIRTLRGPADAVVEVAFGPDGKRIVTLCNDDRATLWDATSGTLILTLPSQGGQAFSPDGRRLVAYSEDNAATVYNAVNGTELIKLQGHTAEITDASFGPDGKRILTGSEDGTAKLWDAATGRELTTLRGHTGEVYVSFSPDGKQALTMSEDGVAKLWAAPNGAELATFCSSSDVIHGVRFSPDGKRIVSGSDKSPLRIWDAATGKEVAVLHGHAGDVACLGIRADGKRIVTGSWDDGTAKLWDVNPEADLTALRGDIEACPCVALSPDGKRVATSADDDSVRIWDMPSRSELAVLRGHTDEVTSIDFSPDGKRVASASSDGTARIWNTATGAEAAVLGGHINGSPYVAFSPDGKRIVTWGYAWDYAVKLWDATTGAKVAAWGNRDNDTSISDLDFSPDGKRIITASGNIATLYDTESGTELVTLRGHKDDVHCVAFSPDGKRIITGAGENDSTARLWDAATGTELRVLRGHTDRVKVVAFSRDQTRIITAATDDTARIWDAVTGAELAQRQGYSHTEWSWRIVVSPDGKRIAARCEDNRLRVWDTVTGAELITLRGPAGRIGSVDFSPDGKQIVTTTSHDPTVRIWDSVPYAQRYAERQAALAAAEKAKPIVTGLHDRLGDWAKVAAAIQEDKSMDEVLRHQALNLVLRSSSAEINARSTTQPSTRPAAMPPAPRPATGTAPETSSVSGPSRHGGDSARHELRTAQSTCSVHEKLRTLHAGPMRAGCNRVQ